MSKANPCAVVLLCCLTCLGQAHADKPWNRHTIDAQFNGADGVRLGDFNRDGLPDVVTGWEESGLVRLYLNPGPEHSKDAWPATTIASAKSPEDAVPIDLDGDGRLDIVSCHEGKQKQLLVHWNDTQASDSSSAALLNAALLNDKNWTTDRFKQLDGVMWMYALPLAKIGSRTTIAVAAKGASASITLLIAPANNARDLAAWTTIRLRDAGWIMSLRAVDMDKDGDMDIVFSDRKGNLRRAGWLEQPTDLTDQWTEHLIGGQGKEVMFLSATPNRCLIAMRKSVYLDCTRSPSGWKIVPRANPKGVVNGKAIGSLPDGRIILTANTKSGPNPDLPGIWIREPSGRWSVIDPTTQVKFDRMELVDLDGDGDLDVMTCEERRNLGVIWYENPSGG